MVNSAYDSLNGRRGQIELKNVGKKYKTNIGEVHALSDINLTIEAGSYVSLIGASGCGKSTMLRVIAGLTPLTAGSVTLDGKEIDGPGSDRGFVFQEHALFPWLTIRQNVAFGLKEARKQNANDEADKWLEITGLTGFGNAFPHQLSGGMCQRACLARSLAMNPAALLLDEPLGALDAFTRMYMQDEILRVWENRKTTMLMVTHDVDEAIYMSDCVVLLSPRPGRIEKTVEIELPRPRDRNDDRFISYRKTILESLHFAGFRREPDFYI
ncbi:MAG: ABC transporter ATP-binding protein [Oscillospiraceae bacterium]|jgi:ABC-type nitrate/sulfonate/bicarbonate transport system ATPase subunit|nr:ABC transporter ATP-binding protein [Oscillospiraceae bacterium]